MKLTSCVEGKMPKGGRLPPVLSILDDNLSCEIGEWNRLWVDRIPPQGVGQAVFRKRREYKPKGSGEMWIFRSPLLNPGLELLEGSIHRV
jgi:hypothetical protein